jgi:ATP-binding cassette subfamily B protein
VTLTTTKIVVANIRYDLLSHLYALSRSFYGDGDRGALHATIVQNTERLDMMSNAIVTKMLPSLLAGGSLSAVLIWLNWRLFLVVLVIAPLFLVMNRILGKRVKTAARALRRSFETFSKGVLFVTESIDLTRAQTAEKLELKRQWKHIEDLRVKSGRFAWIDTAYGLVQSNLAILASVIVLMAGGVASPIGR